jgi:hypothetical protein
MRLQAKLQVVPAHQSSSSTSCVPVCCLSSATSGAWWFNRACCQSFPLQLAQLACTQLESSHRQDQRAHQASRLTAPAQRVGLFKARCVPLFAVQRQDVCFCICLSPIPHHHHNTSVDHAWSAFHTSKASPYVSSRHTDPTCTMEACMQL